MKKLIKDLTLVNWLPNLKIILRGLLNNTEVNAANIKKVSNDIEETGKKVTEIEGEVETLKVGQEVIKTDVEELKKGGGPVEVDNVTTSLNREGKVQVGVETPSENYIPGRIMKTPFSYTFNTDSLDIINSFRHKLTLSHTNGIKRDADSQGNFFNLNEFGFIGQSNSGNCKLYLDKVSGYSEHSNLGFELNPSTFNVYKKEGEEEVATSINLPKPTGKTYNLPLTVNGIEADLEGNIDIPVSESNGEDEIRKNGVFNSRNINNGYFEYLGYLKEGVETEVFEIIYNELFNNFGNVSTFEVRVFGEPEAGVEVFDKELIDNFIKNNKGELLEVYMASEVS